MAVTRVNQGEIVEVPFELPDGSILPHPALVLSNEYLQDYEDGLFYAVLISTKNHYPEFTIPIEDSWLNKPLSKSSFFVTHIIDQFNVDEVMKRSNTYLKARYLVYGNIDGYFFLGSNVIHRVTLLPKFVLYLEAG